MIEIPPARESELHDVPVLVVQLQDDLTRSRLREAFWISVIFHLVLVILAITSPKWVPSFRALPLRSAEQVIQDRQLTYLDLPHDRQKIDKKPNTNTISDKDRVATSRHPSIDRRTLQELRDSARPGPMASTPPQAAAPASPPSPPAQQQAMANPNAGAMTSPFRQQQQQARMQPQAQQPNPFASAPMSPGSAIAQAARGTRIGGGGGGSGGDHGYGQGAPSSSVQSNMDILSDTMGVDFGPYLTRVLHDVRINWYNLIPEVARPPIMKRGKVSIEFVIEKDGRVAGMRVIGPSGDVALDRAAWGGISASNPFPPLPSEFRGPYLALRFHFYYNPEHGELR